MATLGVKAFEPYNFDERQAGMVFQYPEDPSETFVKGDWVTIDTDGQVRLAIDTETGIWGLALEDASGTTDNLLDILVLDETMIFTASQSNAGATQVTVQTQVGLRCSWIKSTVTGSTTLTVVDTADTTTPDLEILGLDPRDPLGDNNGRVLVRVISARVLARGV